MALVSPTPPLPFQMCSAIWRDQEHQARYCDVSPQVFTCCFYYLCDSGLLSIQPWWMVIVKRSCGASSLKQVWWDIKIQMHFSLCWISAVAHTREIYLISEQDTLWKKPISALKLFQYIRNPGNRDAMGLLKHCSSQACITPPAILLLVNVAGHNK